jgi:hypothetical protein
MDFAWLGTIKMNMPRHAKQWWFLSMLWRYSPPSRASSSGGTHDQLSTLHTREFYGYTIMRDGGVCIWQSARCSRRSEATTAKISIPSCTLRSAPPPRPPQLPDGCNPNGPDVSDTLNGRSEDALPCIVPVDIQSITKIPSVLCPKSVFLHTRLSPAPAQARPTPPRPCGTGMPSGMDRPTKHHTSRS